MQLRGEAAAECLHEPAQRGGGFMMDKKRKRCVEGAAAAVSRLTAALTVGVGWGVCSSGIDRWWGVHKAGGALQRHQHHTPTHA